jgi:hypothetical protein
MAEQFGQRYRDLEREGGPAPQREDMQQQVEQLRQQIAELQRAVQDLRRERIR